MSRNRFLSIIVISSICLWWIVSAPPDQIRYAKPLEFSQPSDEILSLISDKDYIADWVTTLDSELPGYDEVVLLNSNNKAIVSGIDGWFWEVELDSGKASRFLDVPLTPAGARLAPNGENLIYFCSSRLSGSSYPSHEQVGLYKLDLATKNVQPLVLKVPLGAPSGGTPRVYAEEKRPTLNKGEANEQNSRDFKFCNDLDISGDGKRIYFTEPFEYGLPEMGTAGTFQEAISLGNNGFIWKYDIESGQTSLIAQNFTFPDGVLIESDSAGLEESLLITETPKFSIARLVISGGSAGTYHTVHENLPGMPDGMDRDKEGRIWIGMLKQRSKVINWVHRTPWIKPVLLRLPSSWMPVSRKTSIMSLSADGATPLFYAEHDGSEVSDIAVVVPGSSYLYLAVVDEKSRGLHQIPYPPNGSHNKYLPSE